jgi:hypothetical protein
MRQTTKKTWINAERTRGWQRVSANIKKTVFCLVVRFFGQRKRSKLSKLSFYCSSVLLFKNAMFHVKQKCAASLFVFLFFITDCEK